MVAKIIRKEKTDKTVEEELLKSFRENNRVEEPGLKIDNVNDPCESFDIINGYEEIIKTQNKKTRDYLEKQGQVLKMFRDWKILS